jgi:endoglucanase
VIVPGFLPATMPVATVPSIWVAKVPSPTTFNEGTTVSFSVQCTNFIPGVSKLIWKLSGTRAGDAGWSVGWPAGWNAVMKARGLTYTALSASANAATVAGLIEVGPKYDGQPVVLTTTCLNNRRTDVAGGNPGTMQITQQLALPAGVTGTLTGSGSPFFVNDTSKTPAGTPTYRLVAFAADGVSPVSSLNEGDSFFLQLNTENMVPGTTFLVAAVNVGQVAIAGGFQAAIKAAAEAAGCACATDYATRGNYNGGVVTIGGTYSDAHPIRIPMTITKDMKTTGTRQLDFLTIWRADGDPGNPTLVYSRTVTFQIQDTSVEPTPSYWRLSAKLVGGQAQYSITSPTGASAASVTVSSGGTVPAGYEAALAAAVAGTPGLSYSGGVLTSTAAWGGSLAWSVTAPASGKHALRLTNPTDDGLIIVGDAVIYFAAPTLPARPQFVTGVNLSGGEFGSNIPGAYGTDYRYPSHPELTDPSLSHQEMDYHFGKGEGIMRLPFRWERVQDTPYGPLASAGTLAGWSGRLDMDRIDEIVTYATGQGRIVLLDVHNYMNGFGNKVGFDTATRTDALVDLWVKLANRYASNPRVWFGIMNEPAGITPSRCRDIMEWVVNAIRGRTVALNRILVAGSFYTGAYSWLTIGNAQAFEGFADPAGNFAFEMHQYFDNDSSGTQGICALNADQRLQAATAWARARGYQIHLGEFMGGDPAVTGQEACGTVVPAACAYMLANRDVWCSWTAWGGGSRWNSTYIFRLDPMSYSAPVDTPQFDLIEPYITTI